jgi:two-component system response regulator PilR (NtrC family)
MDAARERVLIVEDEDAARAGLAAVVESWGYKVTSARDGQEALEKLSGSIAPACVVTDLRMPRLDGLGLLRRLQESGDPPPAIVLTAHGDESALEEALGLGAFWFLEKPLRTHMLRVLVHRAVEINRDRRQRRLLEMELMRAGRLGVLVGSTPAIQEIFRLIQLVAPSKASVLITGESGTGKELVARAIHLSSLRSDQPIVAVNCGAFTDTLLESELFGHVKGSFTNAIADRKGVFEMADRGTLFLDEVGELSMPTQVKLLRILETRTFRPVGGAKDIRVDVRFITATNRNLSQMVAEGQFREDLFYRLNVIPIELPPLRERKDDIPLLAGHFLSQFAKRMNKPVVGMEEAVIDRLLSHSWPGNVRELENTIERAVALSSGERISLADIPPTLLASGAKTSVRALSPSSPETSSPRQSQTAPSAPPIGSTVLPADGIDLERYLLDVERNYILQALDRCNWNLTESAKLLNMTFRSMRYRVSKLGIERSERDPENS